MRAQFVVHFSFMPFSAKEPGEADEHGAEAIHGVARFKLGGARETHESHERIPDVSDSEFRCSVCSVGECLARLSCV